MTSFTAEQVGNGGAGGKRHGDSRLAST